MKADYLHDGRFLDLGGIPSDFKPYSFDQIFARPLTVQELLLINSSKGLDTLLHTYRALDLVTSIDIAELTDGDLAYLMAWVRLYSYPKAPINAIWQCMHPVYFNARGQYCGTAKTLSSIEIKRKGLIAQPCRHKNVYISHGAAQSIHMLDRDLELPDGVDFPRAGTLLEAEEMEDDTPELKLLIPALRCIKEGTTIAEKHLIAKEDFALYQRAEDFSLKYTHGVSEIVPIKCMECNHPTRLDRPINLKSFMFGHNEESIYDMQYNLMSAFHINPDDTMPAKRFLYHHACFVKDMRERKEKADIAKANPKNARRRN